MTISVEDLRHRFTEFQIDGCVDIGAFHELVRSCHLGEATLNDGLITTLFKLLDVSRRGVINWAEFESYLPEFTFLNSSSVFSTGSASRRVITVDRKLMSCQAALAADEHRSQTESSRRSSPTIRDRRNPSRSSSDELKCSACQVGDKSERFQISYSPFRLTLPAVEEGQLDKGSTWAKLGLDIEDDIHLASSSIGRSRKKSQPRLLKSAERSGKYEDSLTGPNDAITPEVSQKAVDGGSPPPVASRQSRRPSPSSSSPFARVASVEECVASWLNGGEPPLL